MTCPRCRAENRDGARFCRECGATFGAVCSGCGAKVEAGSKFCDRCGAPLAATPAQPTASPRFASPESYTPKHLAERILTSKSALEGERKQVTVLFADLKGSMELLADRDPEEARTLLDPVLAHMMEAVHRYEGTVNQVMGDGIMALFGAPVAHEDHAVRGCYAALRMQESVKRYAEGVRREHGITLRIRVGLNSGEVVVRAIGSDLHMDYTAVGQTTHLAARLEQLADAGSILLAPETLALAEGFVRVTALGPMALKGLPAPVEVYELIGVSAVRSRLQAAATRGLSRFVGRDAEIEQLRRALEQARQGHGQVAALVGEPGVGKSRLVFELTHSHRVDGWLVLEAGSVSYGKATSYLPVIDLLKAYFRIGDRDTYRDIREKVTGKLLTLDRGLEPTLPALLSLLDVPVDDPQWSGLDPSQRRQRTLDAVKRLLLREAQAQPLLVVFEDLHWIDAETQALLDSLIESLPTAQMLLLVSYRPEYSHGWGRKTYYSQLRLDPLPPESTDELLEALLGRDASLQPLKTLLATGTGGNPLFLEESVRTLVELGALVGERGAYRLAQAVDTVRVPATVQAILAARIDRLPPEEKRLLETAAVIGKDFAFTLLQAVADEPDQMLRPRLDHLQAAEFLYETSLFPDLEYTFKHALTHEVAYGSLLGERRRALHVRIVEAIERLHADRLPEHVERLAYHALRAEAWERAARYFREAGLKAAARWAHREAIPCFEQAIVALGNLPDSRAVLEQAIDLRFELRNSLQPLAEFTRMVAYLQEAEALAGTLGDPRRVGRAVAFLANHFSLMGDHAEELVAAQRVAAIAATRGDVSLEFQANMRLGDALSGQGRFREAREAFERNDALLQKFPPEERFGLAGVARVLNAYDWTLALAETGDFAEGLARAAQAIRVAEAVDHLYSRAHAYSAAGHVHLRRGDLTAAVSVLERGVALCPPDTVPLFFVYMSAALGYAYALGARLTEATSLLDQSLARAASIGMRQAQSLRMAWLGETHLLAGRADDARQAGRRALELARDCGERGNEAWALRLLGEIASHSESPDVETAERHYHDALALAAELGMRPVVAHCHLGLGKLYRRAGDRTKAQDHLTTAATMYREMDMSFWLEKATAVKELR